MAEIRANLEAVKSAGTKPKKAKKPAPKPAPPPAASISASAAKPKPTKTASAPSVGKSSGGSSKKGKGRLGDDDVLSFDQKKDLSDAIGQLDGSKLEKVIQIIHDGVPEIRDVSVLVS
jgi:bromodomain-containing factor 1